MPCHQWSQSHLAKSRIHSAPITSKAQVSETTLRWPFPDRKWTETIGSRAAINLSQTARYSKTTFDKAERFLDFAHQARIMTATNEVSQDFRVRSRTEIAPHLPFFLERGIDQVSFEPNQTAYRENGRERLDIIYRSFASSRVTHMPNRTSSVNLSKLAGFRWLR